ncbi:hypothetical protein NCLIV_000210 [Neospora caninum Liverpool]|uniref:Uncharacterized protein n=1 Tax=Neospora caninum (strain Liverpool) TaxID=572307 RepID=F0V732_NEOCL|nr:hypothetical protein NCLIV_000210 [Neospora caninum Liverpool]CBZ49523.1 hypothetical protein NCLIV_000210 [Neospora caninum Liverpool]CEL64102.1 TPA: hypothetical protein BN1204_000210 [Neospora caninum Liverpool]|eukprot:XP_003879558.1 hypothetical protein NCLIV_000210 [Neospora caninum Liverpool]
MSHPSRLFERSASSRIPDSSWIDRVPGGSPSQSSLEARNESRVDFASSVEERELTRRATRHHEEGVSDDPQGGASEIEKEATAPPSGEDEAPFPSTVTAGAPRVSLSKETLASDKDSPASAAAVDPRDAPPSPASRAFSPQAMPDFAVSLTEQKAAWSRPVAASLQSPRGPFPPPAVCPYGGDGRVAEAASPCRPADSLSSVAECFVSLADEAPASSLARPSSGKTATSSPESLLSAQPGLSGREPDLTSTAEETGHTHTALPSPTSSVESPTQRLLPVRASNAQNALPPSQIDSNVRVGRDAPLTCLASPTFPNEGETPSEGSAEPHSVSQQEQEANISFWNGQRGDAVTAGPSPEAHAPSEAEQAAEEGERRLETEEDLAKPCQKDTTPVQGTDNTDRSRDQGTWAETRNEDAFQDSTAELTSTERVLATVGKGVTSVFERGAASLVDFFTETLPYLVEPHGAQRPARVRSSSFTPNRQFLATTASTLERPHTAAGSVGRRARSISPLRERVRGFTSGTVFECGGPGEHQSLDSSDEGEPRVPQRRTKNPQELARAVVRKRKDNKGYKTHLHPSPATGPTRLPPLPPRRASADVSRGLGDRLLCFPSAAPQSPSSRPKSTTSLRAQTPPLPTCSRTRSASSRRPEDVERDERRRTSLRPGFMHQSLDGRQHFGPCGAPTIGQNGALPSLDVGVCRLQCASPAQLYTTALSQLPFVSPEQQDYVRVPRIQSFSLQQAGCRRVSSMASEAAFPFVRASPTSALGVPSCASVPGHGGLHSYKVLPRTADSSSSGIYSFSTAVPVSLATDSTFVASRAESPGPHGTVAHLRSAPAVDQSFGVSPHFLHPCLSGSPWRVNPHAATPLRNCTEPPQFGAVPLPAPSKFPIGYRSAASLDMSSGGPLQTDPASGVVCSVTRQLNDTQGLRPCRLLNLAHKIERGRDEGRTETPGRSAARTEELGTLYTRTSTGKEMQTHAKAQYPTERAAGTACTEGKGESSAFTLLTSYGDVGGEYRKPPSRLRALWLREELRRQREAGELTKENFPMEEFQDLLEPFEILEVGGVKVYKLTADWKLPQSVPSREWIERNHREGHEFTACLEDITDVANQLFLPASATA